MLSMLDKKIMERYDNRGIFSVGGTTIIGVFFLHLYTYATYVKTVHTVI